jgi:hypothetical protein
MVKYKKTASEGVGAPFSSHDQVSDGFGVDLWIFEHLPRKLSSPIFWEKTAEFSGWVFGK